MSESTQDLLTILRWAAGADDDVSGISSVDTARLFDLISRHKLHLRFLARAKAERPRWYTRAVSVPLWQTCRTIRAQAEYRIEVLCEITAALPDATPPILIKGFTAYALTDDKNCLRHSDDMDLFFADLEQAKDVVAALGFADPNAWCDAHEAFKRTREGVTLEVHRHYPVHAYPPDLDISAKNAGQPGWAAQTAKAVCTSSPIEYADLLNYSQRVETASGACYWVPGPDMAALVFCLHIFRDYVGRCGVELTTPIPLAEIADLHALIQLPKFDPARFLGLVEKFKAQHSVELAGRMLEACYGENLLPLPQYASVFQQRRIFPQCLNWSIGTWVVLGEPEAMPTRSMTEVIKSLGGADGKPVQNALVRESAGHPLPLGFSMEWTDDALYVEVSLAPLPLDQADLIRLNFGGGSECCWRCGGFESVPVYHSGRLRGTTSVALGSDAYIFRLSLPWLNLISPSSDCCELWLTLGAERWPDLRSTLVPLHLVRG